MKRGAWAVCVGVLCAATLGAVPDTRAEDLPGAQVFATRCAVCHQPQADGIPGSFPSLHDQIVAFGKIPEGREYLVMVLTTGLMGEIRLKGVSYNGVMPAQFGLSEAEVAGVLSFLAGGMAKGESSTPALSAQDVIDIRARHADRSAQKTRQMRPEFAEQ